MHLVLYFWLLKCKDTTIQTLKAIKNITVCRAPYTLLQHVEESKARQTYCDKLQLPSCDWKITVKRRRLANAQLQDYKGVVLGCSVKESLGHYRE